MDFEGLKRDELTEQFLTVFQEFDFCDAQPQIEAPSVSLSVASTPPNSFSSQGGYSTTWSDKSTWRKCVGQEFDFVRTICSLCFQGKHHLNTIYTYRSCSKALANVTSSPETKEQMYTKEREILEGELNKVKKMMEFKDQVIDFINQLFNVFRKRKEEERNLWSEGFLWHFFRLFDVLIVLDTLKNMKGCIVNDFAMCKRILQFFSVGNQEEHIKFNLFLQQFSILKELKEKIKSNFDKGREETLSLLINTSLEWIESESYTLPSELYTLLRCASLFLFLVDDPEIEIQKSKVVKVGRVVSIVKRFPVVPLYGDMQCSLESIIKLGSFDEKLWGGSPLEELVPSQSKDFSLVDNIGAIRESHQDFMLKFATIMEMLKNKRKEERTNEDAKAVADCLTNGIQIVSGWSRVLGFQAAYKYSCPNANVPQDTPEYERVVRRNYSKEECLAIVETIACAKSVVGVFLKNEGFLAPIIHQYIHDDLQQLVHGPLRSMVRHAAKKQRKARFDLFDFRLIGADWEGGIEPNDPALLGQKPPKGESDVISVRSRGSPPTSTLWYLIRSMVFGFIAYKMIGKRALYQERDLGSSKSVQLMEEFYRRSASYSHLLSFSSTLESIVNTAHLWYREFYLAISDTTQFPIDMSMPWILTKQIIDHPPMLDYVLVPFDIYNDASMLALTSLRKRYLYDEIEAELNLAFDQFLFMLSDHAFTSFKTKASRQLLDNSYGSMWREYAKLKQQLEKERAEGGRSLFGRRKGRLILDDIDIPITRIESVLSQRHAQILGRSINICMLVTQRVNALMRKNFDYIIGRFEASELSGIVELELLLNQIRHTHSLISRYLELDDVDTLYREANQSLSATSIHSRIIIHVISELVYDLLPNFNYCGTTHRFVRGPLSFADEVHRPNKSAQAKFMYGSRGLNSAYANLVGPYSKFFGPPHFMALVRVIGKAGFELLASELIKNLQLKLRNNIAPYWEELRGAMPHGTTAGLSYDYGAHGTYVTLEVKLASILGYPELKTEVFQHFREFGNTLIFLYEMDLALQQYNKTEYIVGSAFIESEEGAHAGAIPPVVRAMDELFQHDASILKAPDLRDSSQFMALHADILYNGPTDGSLFKRCMKSVAELIREDRDLFVEGEDLPSLFQTRGLHHVWSALMFVGNMATNTTELATEELFGEGLYWAGMNLLHCLNLIGSYYVFDVNQHIMRVEQVKGPTSLTSHEEKHNPDKKRAIDLFKRFLGNCVRLKSIETRIQAILETYLPSSPPSGSFPPSATLPPSSSFSSSSSSVPSSSSARFTIRPPQSEKEEFASFKTVSLQSSSAPGPSIQQQQPPAQNPRSNAGERSQAPAPPSAANRPPAPTPNEKDKKKEKEEREKKEKEEKERQKREREEKQREKEREKQREKEEKQREKEEKEKQKQREKEMKKKGKKEEEKGEEERGGGGEEEEKKGAPPPLPERESDDEDDEDYVVMQDRSTLPPAPLPRDEGEDDGFAEIEMSEGLELPQPSFSSTGPPPLPPRN